MPYKDKQHYQAGQEAYHEARKAGHSKEDARKMRDNWKYSNTSYNSNDDDSDEGGYFILDARARKEYEDLQDMCD